MHVKYNFKISMKIMDFNLKEKRLRRNITILLDKKKHERQKIQKNTRITRSKLHKMSLNLSRSSLKYLK